MLQRLRFKEKISVAGSMLLELVLASVILMIVVMVILRFGQTTMVASTRMATQAQAIQIAEQIHTFLRKSDFRSLESFYTVFPNINLNGKYTASASIESLAPDNTRVATIVVHPVGGKSEDYVSKVKLSDEQDVFEPGSVPQPRLVPNSDLNDSPTLHDRDDHRKRGGGFG